MRLDELGWKKWSEQWNEAFLTTKTAKYRLLYRTLPGGSSQHTFQQGTYYFGGVGDSAPSMKYQALDPATAQAIIYHLLGDTNEP